jgi:NADH-quinone oxidoreductase subunit H
MNPFIVLTLVKAALIAFVLVTVLAYLVWVERKVLAHIQLRVGPNRVGPHGLLQPLSDLIKLLFKEGVIPSHVNKPIYLMAPFLAVMLALSSIAVLPLGPEIEVFGVKTNMGLADINIGILFVLAVGSLGVYGVALAGWASNNKYSLIGGLRSSAQMISYELPMAMALVAPLLLFNTLSLREIVEAQSGYYFGVIPRWAIFQMPLPQILSFILFLIASFAETNRIPFDLPEAENELVAGFHTEYSSMLFAAFFTAEYGHIVTACMVGSLVFLGGWQPLWPAEYGSIFFPTIVHWFFAGICFWHSMQPARWYDKYTMPVVGVILFLLGCVFLVPVLQPILVPLFWLLFKVGFLIFVFIWIRGTLPRFRYDQLMRFAWTFMFPVAVANLLITGLMVALTSK